MPQRHSVYTGSAVLDQVQTEHALHATAGLQIDALCCELTDTLPKQLFEIICSNSDILPQTLCSANAHDTPKHNSNKEVPVLQL